ncbi:MAG: hypothetical protein J6A83_00030 [Clostridia bacterium]|nr:hypothetical protein [Clostridia bacterium]
MNFAADIWNFYLENQADINPLLFATIALVTAGVCIVLLIICCCVAHIRRKRLIRRHDMAFRHFTNDNVYNTKLIAVQKSLNFLDLYFSWLSTDEENKPVRERTTTLELTKMARECYNELYTNCDNKELVIAFADIIFNEASRTAEKFNAYRALARKELGLAALALGSNTCFIPKISTEELEKNEAEAPVVPQTTKSYKVTLSRKKK